MGKLKPRIANRKTLLLLVVLSLIVVLAGAWRVKLRADQQLARARPAREAEPNPIRTEVAKALQQQSDRDLAEPPIRESNRKVQQIVLRSIRWRADRVRPRGETRAALHGA